MFDAVRMRVAPAIAIATWSPFTGMDVRILAERLNEAGIVVSARRNVLRFSPHLYNDADDIQQALTAIDRCLRRPVC